MSTREPTDPVNPERHAPVENWSIQAGFYNPGDPRQVLGRIELERIEEEVRHWAGDAKNRFWARLIVATAISACGIKFESNPTVRDSVELALNEDFAQATKYVIKGPDNEEDLQPADPVMVSGLPVMDAIHDMTTKIDESHNDPHTADSIYRFSELMIRFRLAKELRYGDRT